MLPLRLHCPKFAQPATGEEKLQNAPATMPEVCITWERVDVVSCQGLIRSLCKGCMTIRAVPTRVPKSIKMPEKLQQELSRIEIRGCKNCFLSKTVKKVPTTVPQVCIPWERKNVETTRHRPFLGSLKRLISPFCFVDRGLLEQRGPRRKRQHPP